MNRDFFVYGTQFYRPPNPPINQRKKDLENIKYLGFNTIKIFAEWNWINYDEGKFDLSELVEIIEHAKKLDIYIIVNTRLENCPYWVAEKYPESHYLSAKNTRIELMERPNTPTGGWPGLCFDNQKVKDEAELFLKQLVINLDKYENVKYWDCWNEPHMEPLKDSNDNLFCYCNYTINRYRNWLKDRYGSIENLNNLWFKRYRNFCDINPPRQTINGYVDMMEWRKFINYTMVDHMDWRIDTIKKYLQKDYSKIISHTGANGLITGLSVFACSDYEMAKNLDIFGLSFYPFWNGTTMEEYGGVIELTRSMAKDKEIWQAELQCGAVNSAPTGLTRSRVPDRKHIRSWNFITLGSEIKGIIYWQYRHEMIGPEAPSTGMANRDGSLTYRSDEASKICKFVNKHASIFNSSKSKKREVGVFINRDSSFFDYAAEGNENDVIYAIWGINKYLQMNNIIYDFLIEEEINDLKKYKVVLLLSPLIMDDTIAKGLIDYVKGGGILISDCLIGLFNSYGMSNEIVPSDGLSELFGAKQIEWRQFDELNREDFDCPWVPVLRPVRERKPDIYLKGCGKYKEYEFRLFKFLESYELKGGESFLEYDGESCGVKNTFGKGRTYLFGTNFCSALQINDKRTIEMMDHIFEEIGVSRNFVNNLMIKEIGSNDYEILLIINPTDKKIEEELEIPYQFKIYDIYINETIKLLPDNKLKVSLVPEDSNCIILKKYL